MGMVVKEDSDAVKMRWDEYERVKINESDMTGRNNKGKDVV